MLNKKIAGHVIAAVLLAGGIGAGLFVALLYVMSSLTASGPPYDVVAGWGAALLMIIDIFGSIFLAGVLAVLLAFKEITTKWEAIVVSFFAGLIAMIIPLLIGILLGTYSAGLFFLCIAVLAFCLLLAIAGGVITFLLLSFLKKRKGNRSAQHSSFK